MSAHSPTHVAKAGPARLLEREAELDRLGGVVAAAASGSGGVLVVEGPAGIGKTALLEAAAGLAAAAGLRCARAVGGPLERDLPHGAVRQLLTPLVMATDAGERAALFGDAAAPAAALLGLSQPTGQVDTATLLHSLYWLVANLAERQPLLLLADDAQWFDVSSLRFVAQLARRVADLPVTLVVGTRPPEPGPAGELLYTIIAELQVELVEPGSLTEAAVGALIAERLGVSPDEAFRAVCHEAAGGNPFLTLGLVRALADAGVTPVAASAATVVSIGAAGAGRTLLRRLRGLPADAHELIRAVAVLGPDAYPGHVTGVTRIERQRLADAVEPLVRAGLLVDERPLRLIHPLVKAAVLDDMPATRRRQLHAKAAALLAEAAGTTGYAADHAAAHLLATDPAADPWAVSVLLDVGRAASGRGAPEEAVTFLQRALAEPPPAARRAEVLVALGTAEAMIAHPAAAGHLRTALDLITEPAELVGAALTLRRALLASADLSRVGEATEVLIDLLPRVAADPELTLNLQASIAQTAFIEPAAARLAAPYLARVRELAITAAELPLPVAAVGAAAAMTANEPADAVGRLAASAMASWRRSSPDRLPAWASTAVQTLTACDHPDTRPVVDWALATARRQGDVLFTGVWLFARAVLGHREGALVEAQADAEAAIEALRLYGSPDGIQGPVGALAEILIDRGELTAAADLLARHGFPAEAEAGNWHVKLAMAMARLSAEQAGLPRAAAHLHTAGDRCLSVSIVTPAWAPWRAELATVAARLGNVAEAIALASEDLTLARRFGTPRVVGIALRALGVAMAAAQDAPAAERHLAEAVAVLDGSPASLELVRARLELGAAYRRRKARAEAQQALLPALDLATACGATALAERARVELVGAGARPRRHRLTGTAALTPAELRVARLAGAGQTNREIAQSMFLSQKTIEAHLASTYRKLGIGGRAELAIALAT